MIVNCKHSEINWPLQIIFCVKSRNLISQLEHNELLYFAEKYWDYRVKLSSLNHCTQVALLTSDFFKQKWWWHKPETLVNNPCECFTVYSELAVHYTRGQTVFWNIVLKDLKKMSK